MRTVVVLLSLLAGPALGCDLPYKNAAGDSADFFASDEEQEMLIERADGSGEVCDFGFFDGAETIVAETRIQVWCGESEDLAVFLRADSAGVPQVMVFRNETWERRCGEPA